MRPIFKMFSNFMSETDALKGVPCGEMRKQSTDVPMPLLSQLCEKQKIFASCQLNGMATTVNTKENFNGCDARVSTPVNSRKKLNGHKAPRVPTTDNSRKNLNGHEAQHTEPYMISTNGNLRKEIKKEEKEEFENVGNSNDSRTAIANKRPRTSQDFYHFCKAILDYVNYEDSDKQEEVRELSASPLGSTGSVPGSLKSDPSDVDPDDDSEQIEISSDDESHSMVTCFCGKPFAGRPMIECSECETWLHLSCVKLRKNNIPKVFFCHRCRQRMNTKGVKSGKKDVALKRKSSS